MHKNYRRRIPSNTTKRNGPRGCLMLIYSMKPMKRQKARDRRAEERRFIEVGKYDHINIRYPKNIIWEYW